MPEDVERGVLRRDMAGSWGWIVLVLSLLTVFIYIGFQYITSVLFGLFIYYGTRPIYSRLKNKIGKTESAVFSVLIVGIPMVVLAGFILFIGLQQGLILVQRFDQTLLSFLADTEIYSKLSTLFSGSFISLFRDEGFWTVLNSYWGVFSSFTGRFLGFLFSMFLAFVSAFFMYDWGPKLKEDVVNVLGRGEGVLERFIKDLDSNLSTIFFANLVNALVTALIGSAVFVSLNFFIQNGLRIPSPIALGVLTGFASLIPLVGPKLVYFPVFLYMVVHTYLTGTTYGYFFSLVFLVVTFFIVDGIPDMVIRPLISGRNTSQGALFVAYLLGPAVFGVKGFLLLPVLVVTYISFHRIVLPGFKKEEE